MKLPISIIVLTRDEQENITYCLDSVKLWAEEVFIVDSYSKDSTLTVAKSYRANICQHRFENQALQFNWALQNLPISTPWIMRLDADEYVTPELSEELGRVLPSLDGSVSGFYVKRKVFFMGRWIKHGGFYPIWLLRVFRKGVGFAENRFMDEHLRIREGKVLYLKHDIVDSNHKTLHWWIRKHDSYALREALDLLNVKYKLFYKEDISEGDFAFQAKRKRWVKEEIYSRLPIFLRVFLYFFYRYFMRLGFADGIEGLIWHSLQGFWYRFLVDANIYYIEKKARVEKKEISLVIKEFLLSVEACNSPSG